jgi:hypothetical protein
MILKNPYIVAVPLGGRGFMFQLADFAAASRGQPCGSASISASAAFLQRIRDAAASASF